MAHFRYVAFNRSAKRRQLKLRFPLPHVPGMSVSRSALNVAEADVLPTVLKALQLHPRVAWARRMNTGAGRFIRPDGSVSQFMRFAFKGCGDILGQLKDGRFLAVETKATNGSLAPEQADFLATVNRFGGVAFVARSYEDVQRQLSPEAIDQR